jgi:DNA-binding CsgD family transcriptional regulator
MRGNGRHGVKNSAATAHIRQLCCLGLGGEAIMPALLRDLHDLVPCDSAGFFWVDDSHEMSNLYAEKMLPPDLMRLFFTRFYHSADQPFRGGFEARAKRGPPIAVAAFDTDFYRSEYYNLIWHHLDAHHVLYAMIREGGRVLGQLSLYRTARDPPFGREDQERLAGVVRYIAHGLSPAPAHQGDWTTLAPDAAEASGLLILDREGRLLQASSQGRRLLFLAACPRICGDALAALRSDVPAPLADLCVNLGRVFAGEPAPPPALHVRNAWGDFDFRAYWMDGAPGASDATIGVTVCHHECAPIALLRAMKALPLSSTQKAVILMLARGDSQQEIARQMNVSLNTTHYHVKQIYEKLDAHDPADVMRHVFAGRGGREARPPRT